VNHREERLRRFSKRIDVGYTLRQVSAELKRRGIRTPRDRDTWSICIFGMLLRNDFYLGVYRFHKSKHGME